MSEVASRYAIDTELAVQLPRLPQLDLSDIESARAVAAARPTAPLNYPAGVSVREEQATSARRDASVRVRLYIPNELAEGASALLYLPGGGFVIPPSPASYVWCANFADEIGALVVLVEYRLAPENPFPAGFVDALTALEWLAAESGRLGIAGDRIAIGGDSAGAALAAGLALWCRDHGGPRLCLQYLGIPVLDDRLQTRSMTFLRRSGARDSGKEHDPRRPTPSSSNT